MTNFLDTTHKRKSALITSVIMSVLVVLLFFVGLSYFDPPQEYGIAVNFGTSEFGMGNEQPTEPLKSASEKIENTNTESYPETSSNPINSKSEDVITQDSEDAIAIQQKNEAKKRLEEELKKQKEKADAIAKQRAEEEAKRKKLDALIGGINNSNGSASGGEGDDNVAGDKGKVTGDPNASGYYGNGGTGGGGDYQLGNRKPLSRPKPNYICNEEGLVVVSVEVDKNGTVVKASAGVKGTTNMASCLLTQAEAAALKTKWQPDSNAPTKQIGTIKYRFSLSQ